VFLKISSAIRHGFEVCGDAEGGSMSRRLKRPTVLGLFGFKITPDGIETALHNFTCGKDGCFPYLDEGVVLDGKGNIYGTTSSGGDGGSNGTVYETSPDGSEKILHAFTGDDGIDPSGLIMDGHIISESRCHV
jgi:uncharacterized repeat protein (TIGR03803 family)